MKTLLQRKNVKQKMFISWQSELLEFFSLQPSLPMYKTRQPSVPNYHRLNSDSYYPPGQTGSRSSCSGWLLHTPQTSRTGASPLDEIYKHTQEININFLLDIFCGNYIKNEMRNEPWKFSYEKIKPLLFWSILRTEM